MDTELKSICKDKITFGEVMVLTDKSPKRDWAKAMDKFHTIAISRIKNDDKILNKKEAIRKYKEKYMEVI